MSDFHNRANHFGEIPLLGSTDPLRTNAKFCHTLFDPLSGLRESEVKDKLSVLWHETRGDYVAMALAHFQLLELLLKTYMDSATSRAEAIKSFVAQCDYTGEIVWQGYKLGIIGFPIYRRVRHCDAPRQDRRWRKLLIPGCFMINPWEDSDHYHIGFRWSKSVIASCLLSMGAEVPSPLIAQVNGDWTPSLRKDHLDFSDFVLNDLIHFYRFLEARNDLSIPTPIFMKYCRMMAYAPNFYCQSLYWETQLARMDGPWGCPSFGKYFKKQCLRSNLLAGRRVWIALFWCGHGSKARAGHPAESNLAELAVKLCKEVAAKHAATKREDLFLEALETRLQVAMTAPGLVHSWASSDQGNKFSMLNSVPLGKRRHDWQGIACAAFPPSRPNVCSCLQNIEKY